MRSLRAAGGAANTVGNVLSIADAAASGGSQRQAFGYDVLDRLITAEATGGDGTYDQTYEYNEIGNLTNSSDLGTYVYDAASPVTGCSPRTQPEYVGWVTAEFAATQRLLEMPLHQVCTPTVSHESAWFAVVASAAAVVAAMGLASAPRRRALACASAPLRL